MDQLNSACTNNISKISEFTNMEVEKEWLETLLKSKENLNSISKVIKVESKPAAAKGDNYSGDVDRVIIDVILKSGRKCRKSVIIKNMPTSEFRRISTEKIGVFVREITVYRDLLPGMENIMREFNDYTEFMWGKCIHYNMYDKIVLEDLKEQGYTMMDRKQGLDFEHCLTVVRSLAKFHATSAILKERNLICLEIFGKNIFANSFCQQIMEKFQGDMLGRFADLVESWGDEWKPVAEKIRKEIISNMVNIFMELMTRDDSKFNVLCHGDCWTNNMLFKHGLDDVTPISVKFIDFQISFYNSPAFDLKYFLSSSPNRDVRRNSIPNLLKVYHQTLSKQLALYKYSGKIITLKELEEEMIRLDIFGVMTAIQLLPIILLEKPEDVPDMEDFVKNLMDDKPVNVEGWQEYFKPPAAYSEIMKELLTESIKNNSIFKV